MAFAQQACVQPILLTWNIDMSNIAKALRRFAAARQTVSMENDADPTVQGQEGLDENELKQVADKAAAEVDGGESTEGADAGEDAGADTGDIGGEVPGGEDAAAEGEQAPPADAGAVDAGAPAAEPASTEPTADEIQTPAESEFQEATGEQTATDPTDPNADPLDPAGEVPGGEQTADAGQSTEAAEAGEAAAADAGAADVTGGEAPPADAGADLGATDAPATEAPVEAGTDASAAESTAPEVAAPEAAAGTDVVPPPEGSDAAAEAEPAEAAAATPESIEKSDAVAEVVELTEAAASASSAEEVLQQARGVQDGLTELADTVDAINETGGVDMQSFAVLQLAAKAFTSQIDRAPINFGISMEQLVGGAKLKVSLEGIEELVGEMQLIDPELEREALKELDRMVCAIKDSLPAARDRVRAVVARAKSKTSENAGQIELDPNLGAALTIDGTLPQDLSDGLFNYVELGKSLINSYAAAAFRAATEASMLTNSIEFNSVEGFWEKIGQRVDAVKDPRQLIPASLLSSCLPGGAPLFSEIAGPAEASNPVATRLYEYADGLVPLEATVAVSAQPGSENSYPALTNAKITSIGDGLLTVLDMDKICELLEQGGKLWPDAKGSIRHLREVLDGAPQDIAAIAGGEFPQLVKFLEVNYSLATWPLLNYLTNMVFTANAFVLLAELSLKAVEQAPEPVAAVDEVVATDPVADNAPPAEGTEDVGELPPEPATEDVPPTPEAGAEELPPEPAV